MIGPPTATVDTECYRDYWLCAFDTGEEFEQYDGHPLDRAGLAAALARYLIITFNGNNYDMPLITLALGGATCDQLKNASDAIIVRGVKSWDIARVPDWINHVDLFDVAPGQGSLKSYGARMHTRKLQDLPFDPSATIDAPARALLREYCRNDLVLTRELYATFPAQLELRRHMGAEYGVDLRSKSDAQIAETVMKTILPFKVQRPSVPGGMKFYYRAPAWLKFDNVPVLELLARSPFTIGENGSPVMTEELANTLIRIGGSAYQMGSGGLHSTESQVTRWADDDYTLSDHDVASYYPSLILLTGIYPAQIGPVFSEIYRSWYTRRLAAKAAGNKRDANSLKTLLNGTFGKLGSPWSIFYAPSEMIQVTITGQLALLMLIERLEMFGASVVSANTDGIVVRCHKSLHWLRDAAIADWERVTGLVTEDASYKLLASRDVNSYVAIKTDGEVKTKGAFAAPEPGPSGWPNPSGQICVDAAVAYLQHGTPLARTINACDDIRQFVYIRKVTGGGYLCPGGTLPAKTTLIAMRRLCGDLPRDALLTAYDALVAAEVAARTYLGKTVRWYYATGSAACIVTPKGGMVARTEGCAPLMELPDAMPADVDREWYVREAVSLLVDMGVDAPVN